MKIRHLLATMAAIVAGSIAPPAHAAGAGTMTLVLEMPSFPGVSSDGYATGYYNGVAFNRVVVNQPVTGSFAYMATGPTCPSTLTADGVLTIDGTTVGFHYQRVGVLAALTFDTSGFAFGQVEFGGNGIGCTGWSHVTEIGHFAAVTDL